MLDTVREVHTPEGVALRLPAAGPMPRALAWAIDFGIRMALLMAASMVLGIMGEVALEGTFDADFVARYGEGFEEFRDAMLRYTPAWAADGAWVKRARSGGRAGSGRI